MQATRMEDGNMRLELHRGKDAEELRRLMDDRAEELGEEVIARVPIKINQAPRRGGAKQRRAGRR